MEILIIVLMVAVIVLLWSRSKLKKELFINREINRELRAYESPMHDTSSGSWEAATLYVNNEILEAKLTIWLFGHDWSEIQEKLFYKELIQHLDTLKTQDSRAFQHERAYSEET